MLRRALASLTLLALVLPACGSGPTPTRRPPSTLTPTLALPTATPLPVDTPVWFRETVVYEIFPRSFYDSDGDGVGDLQGIVQKLDYVRDLGATTLWVTSVFSATSFHGYAVADHLTIAPDLGTQQDMVALVNEAHTRGLRVLMDLVAGRTSNQHPFFLDAYRNPESFYSDWYQWDNAAHTAYKAASSDRSDPLLNLGNPVVQRYMLEVARHWMDLDDDGDLTDGVDGFVDHAQLAPPEFWKALRKEVKAANPDFLLLGYAPGATLEQLAPYYEDQFDAMLDTSLYSILAGHPDRVGDGLLNGQGNLASIASHLEQQAQAWPAWAQALRLVSFHDANRLASKVRGDRARIERAAVLYLTLPGTPLVYYGEEIGMKGSLGSGADADKYRREPMDWYAAESGPGMTTWFKPRNRQNRPNDGISVEEQAGVKGSLLEFYRAILAQRRAHPTLGAGGFQFAQADRCKTCLAYWRWDESDLYLVLFNMSAEAQPATIDFTRVPRPVRGAGEDVLRGGLVSVPSNARYTVTLDPNDIRLLHWGKP